MEVGWMDEKTIMEGVKGMTTKYTGFMGLLPAVVNSERTVWKIRDNGGNGVRVLFNTPTDLTIFQHDLLYCLFVLKKKPRDFGGYFKCVAGKRFLESIGKVWLLEVMPNPEVRERLVF